MLVESTRRCHSVSELSSFLCILWKILVGLDSRCSFPRLTWPALFTNFEGWIFSCLACTAARGQHVKGGGGRARKQFSKCNKCQTFNCNRNLFVLFFVRRFVAMQSFSNTAIQSNSRRTQRFHRQTRYDFSESWLALPFKKGTCYTSYT